MQNEKNKLILSITDNFVSLVNELKIEKPEKKFDFYSYESNMYWCISWKTDRFIKEFFQIHLYDENEKLSLIGEHRVNGVLENLSDEYFWYKEKTLIELSLISKDIIRKTKESILLAINKEFDDFDSSF